MMKKKNKPIPEAKDAKEVAKKLIRSGAIAAIKVCRLSELIPFFDQ